MILQDLWQVHYQILLTTLLKESIKSNVNTQQTFVLVKTSSRRLSSSSSDNVLKVSWRRLDQEQYICLGQTSSEGVFKTSSRCLNQDKYIGLSHMSSRRFQDVLKTSCQNVFKISSRGLARTFSRHLFETSCKDVFKTFSRPLQDVSSN